MASETENPENYTFQVEAMSSEKLSFILTAIFSIRDRLDEDGNGEDKDEDKDKDKDKLSLKKYVKPPSKNHVKEVVHGIIEGMMTQEVVFTGTEEEFKEEISQKVQLQLKHLGVSKYYATFHYQTKVQGENYEVYNKQKAAAAVVSQMDKETAPQETTAANGSANEAVDGLTSAMKDVGLQRSPFWTNPSDSDDDEESESSYSDVDDEEYKWQDEKYLSSQSIPQEESNQIENFHYESEWSEYLRNNWATRDVALSISTLDGLNSAIKDEDEDEDEGEGEDYLEG